jgi:DNA-binding NarL/FixJ family response regulator
MPIKLLLADDHDLFRAGLRSLLEKHSDMRVVAEVADGQAVLAAVRQYVPHVVVLDISMPGVSGLDVTRQLAARSSPVRVLALSMHATRGYVEQMLRAGALGYLTKRAATDNLVAAIRAVAAGRRYLEPSVAAVLAESLVSGAAAEKQSGATALSPRQREILQLIAEGNTSKEIAHRLDISIRTVDASRQQIMQKLKMRSVAELTRFAIQTGISPLNL